MNWTALFAGVNLLALILGFAWLGGRDKQRGVDDSRRVEQLETAREEHRARLDGHDVELAKMEAWREGYNAGSAKARVHGNG